MAGNSRKPPTDGDVGLCAGCGEPALYRLVDGTLTQVMPTDAQMRALLADPRIQRYRAAISIANADD